MVRTIGTVFVHLASFISILGFYFTLHPISSGQPAWHIVALTVVGLIYLLFAASELYAYFKNRPKRFSLDKPHKIKKYMQKWIQRGGQTVIFTRDMSWADEEQILSTLNEKANRNELTVCIQNEIPLALTLKQRGANVVPYSELGHVPRSRFTIIDFEKDGARVAVGGAVNNKHVIQEFRNGEHPFFAVAEDLAKILIAYKRRADAAAD